MRLARRLGSDTLYIGRSIRARCCGLLAGWDRIHLSMAVSAISPSLRLARRLGSDTLCIMPSRCFTRVAACSQAGIGYTIASMSNASDASCGLLAGWDRIHSIATRECRPCVLRLARRLGSDTLRRYGIITAIGCGLLAGWDRIHSCRMRSLAVTCCGLLAGWDRIHYDA